MREIQADLIVDKVARMCRDANITIAPPLADREIRIIVRPDRVSDVYSAKIARDIVKRIESELEYPGQIKVTVIRETRAVEYAK